MTDSRFRVPRVWSNRELARFAPLFAGTVVNISGWRDEDKEGRRYRDYFTAATEYHISNYKTEARGFQGNLENEFFLDLSKPLTPRRTYDTVFNHTVLEHVFEIDVAFANLCSLSADVAVIVVPFLQEEHGHYGDYWRFTPQAVDRLFAKNGLSTIYLSYNDHPRTSVYVFAVGSRHPSRWSAVANAAGNRTSEIYDPSSQAGQRALLPSGSSLARKILRAARHRWRKANRGNT